MLKLTLLLVSISVASNLKFSFDGELGYVPRSMSLAYEFPSEYDWVTHKEVFFITLSPKFDFIFIYDIPSMTTFSCKAEDVCFHPFRALFENEVGVYYKFSTFQLSLYWKHQCSHSITVSNIPKENHNLFDNMYDKIALRFSYKN